jgi:plasmid rolling circle replication initiator protein Rep
VVIGKTRHHLQTQKCREAKYSEVKSHLMWWVAKGKKVKWSEWSEVKESAVGEGGRVSMEKVYKCIKGWEVKDCGEIVSELMIGK